MVLDEASFILIIIAVVLGIVFYKWVLEDLLN